LCYVGGGLYDPAGATSFLLRTHAMCCTVNAMSGLCAVARRVGRVTGEVALTMVLWGVLSVLAVAGIMWSGVQVPYLFDLLIFVSLVAAHRLACAIVKRLVRQGQECVAG
jgi:hypothetical protein